MTTDTNIAVKIADLKVIKAASGSLTTHALGSCIGVTVYDPVTRVGGLLHFMLPMPSKGASGNEISVGPHPYASAAVPELFRAIYAAGGEKERLIVCVAGGAETLQAGSALKIGSRNWTVLRKLLWKNNVAVAASDTAGKVSRNLSLDLADGRVSVTKNGATEVLWSPHSK